VGSFPRNVTGPLTAGVIPWGYGYLTYDNLTKNDYSAIEKKSDGRTEIEMTLIISEDLDMVVTLDPEKDYAALSCIITHRDVVEIRQFGNYQLVSGIWVPTTIMIEKRDVVTNNLLSGDYWNFTNISGDIPRPESFNVEYEHDALVSYSFDSNKKPRLYRYSHFVNTELLLAESLAYAASEGIRPQNCATAALQFAAFRLDKDILNQQLGRLVTEPNQTTSLYALKQLAQNLGFYCQAVETDIQTLKNLSGCQAILHIPGKNHFVLLDHIDSQYVWIIDLSSHRFFYRTDINFFGMDWTEGTALLISNQPILLQETIVEIPDAQLHDILGGIGYQCTYLIQDLQVIFCQYLNGYCFDWYEIFFPCWGCQPAESGSCTFDYLFRWARAACINHPIYPVNCTCTGEWEKYYMYACYCMNE
jgi:hypothetical protein